MADFRKGGYSLVDFEGFNLGSDLGKTLPGIYDRMKTAYEANKLVILTNVANSTSKYTPVPVYLAKEEDDDPVFCILGGVQYNILPNDTIVQA